jgi:putative copper export protein
VPAEAQLAGGLDIFRLSLHVLAAAVWIGGQIVVAGLMPTVRGFGPDAPGKVARAFARLSWPAFLVLLATGIWNVAAAPSPHSTAWNAVLGIKILIVVLAGAAVGAHTRVREPRWRGATAGLGLAFSLVAMVLGVALAG